MKIYKSEIYGECLQPASFVELTKLITEKENQDSYEFVPVRMWRGQANIDWKIDSSAFRRIQLGTSYLKDKNAELESYERHLLRHATHKGFRIQNGRELSDLELLAKLQHHGAATRLVDFSRNAFVALWFCVNYQTDKMGLLIGIHSHYIGGMESELDSDSYNEVIKGCKKHEYPQVYESPTLSSRISAQHAQFLYSTVSKEKTGSLQLPMESKAKLFIAISSKLKSECLQILESVFDFRTKMLFPDLDGFGMANSMNENPDKMDRW
ncbi:FRG domain-containing protein [Ancylomarina sp. 16SWW S1-10-2]|uniref:FRG domain-containing protein n=1 Tax=Ancylomarina sp. 16SWW S1-10-2 TaxID=2499681 RepID=UPI0012AEAD8C|nr:FRG domain-containing protein [Ancylomarina sp. 16SWW S1-10-2]MRT91954.1 FRG domain-containing protein [Ancylomarina sp. 16SWW S1-10-2]